MAESGGCWARFHEERVATTLATAFIWIRDRARDGEWAKPDETGLAGTMGGN